MLHPKCMLRNLLSSACDAAVSLIFLFSACSQELRRNFLLLFKTSLEAYACHRVNRVYRLQPQLNWKILGALIRISSILLLRKRCLHLSLINFDLCSKSFPKERSRERFTKAMHFRWHKRISFPPPPPHSLMELFCLVQLQSLITADVFNVHAIYVSQQSIILFLPFKLMLSSS